MEAALEQPLTPFTLCLQAKDVCPDNKVKLVASALKAALQAGPAGQGLFLRPVLTSFAVVGDLEGALSVIKQVKEHQLASDGEVISCCSVGVASLTSFSVFIITTPWPPHNLARQLQCSVNVIVCGECFAIALCKQRQLYSPQPLVSILLLCKD